jgi:UDP-N-acetylglucosamine 2-epimerase (non-hydrolysing)
MSTRLLFVFGTRPEAIKLAPLVLQARERPEEFDVIVCATAQHREMLDQVLALYGIVPDCDLDLMRPGQDLASLTARILTGVDQTIGRVSPGIVIVQGDTTTTMAASLAAFYRGVPVAHVEAGLRTGRKDAPFPEEVNRTMTSRIADWHFAPTERARANLLAEGIAPASVHVTGNTVIDALLWMRNRLHGEIPVHPGLDDSVFASGERLVLVTGHRRENFGAGFEAICRAIARLAAAHPDVHFVYPVHLNPNVTEPVQRLLGTLPNVHLLEPLAYAPFVALMDRSHLVMTDSGGVQEEAPALGKPVLVLRETTERPEALAAGTALLVGTEEQRIVDECSKLLDDPMAHDRMARAHNPYGDGQASRRILDVLAAWRASSY